MFGISAIILIIFSDIDRVVTESMSEAISDSFFFQIDVIGWFLLIIRTVLRANYISAMYMIEFDHFC